MNQLIKAIIEAQDIEQLKEVYKETPNSLFETDNKGKNILHLACEKQNQKTPSLINFLLEIGLDPLAVDAYFKNSLDIAKENKNVWAVARLKLFINEKIRL